jgi:DNA double-strand break repair rad50 ATPase
MKIDLERVEIKNFRSYGNKKSVIEFKNGIDIVRGMNGRGKTTAFVHSIIYALYGVGAYSENVSDLINRHSGREMVVSLVFSKGDKRYKVSRGRNPNILDIYEDDLLLDFDGMKEADAFIQDVLLEGISQSTFSSLFVVQTANPAYSIFRMNKPQRRTIIEQLFDLSKFKEVQTLAKKDLDETTKELTVALAQKEQKDRELAKINSELAEFKKQEEFFLKERDEKIKALEVEIKALEEKLVSDEEISKKKITYTKYTEVLDGLKKNLYEYTNKKKTIKSLQDNLCEKTKAFELLTKSEIKKPEELQNELISNAKQSTMATLKNDVSEIAKENHHDNCPVTSYFESINVETLRDAKDIEREIKESSKKLQDIEVLKSAISNLAKDIEKQVDEMNKLVGENKDEDPEEVLKGRIEKGTALCEKLKEELEAIKIVQTLLPQKRAEMRNFSTMKRPELPKSQLEVIKKDFETLIANIELLTKKEINLRSLYDFLKKDNIKNFQIKHTFPPLERAINNILRIFFDGNIRIKFTNDLEPAIFKGNVEVAYQTFSGGEKKRLDLAFLFAVREFLVYKNNLDTNVLIMDELLDGELDDMGVDAVFEYIKTLIDCDIILVTHRKMGITASREFNIIKKKFSEIEIKA